MARARKFNGKVYILDGSFRLKPDAQDRAYILRYTGHLVRVTKYSGSRAGQRKAPRWSVWKRKK